MWVITRGGSCVLMLLERSHHVCALAARGESRSEDLVGGGAPPVARTRLLQPHHSHHATPRPVRSNTWWTRTRLQSTSAGCVSPGGLNPGFSSVFSISQFLPTTGKPPLKFAAFVLKTGFLNWAISMILLCKKCFVRWRKNGGNVCCA